MSSIHLRQQILNYVNIHQKSSPAEVALGMGLMQDTVSRAMFNMVEIGEMYREKDLKERGQPYRYEALVETASTVKRKPNTPRLDDEPPKPKPTEPWRFVNHPDKPIPNQGGQGAVRRQVGIQASAGML